MANNNTLLVLDPNATHMMNATEKMATEMMRSLLEDAKEMQEGVNVSDIIITVGYMFLMVLITGGNLLLLLAIFRTPSLQTFTNYLIGHLAVSDSLVGLQINQRLVTHFWPHLLESYSICAFRLSARLFVSQGAGLFLIGIGLERCVGIFRPLHYNLWLSKTRLHVCAAIIWLYSFVFALPCVSGVLTWKPGDLCEFYRIAPVAYVYWLAFYLLICVAIILIIYLGIVRAAMQQQVRMELAQGTHPDGRLRGLKSNIRAMRTYLMVVLIFSVTWVWTSVLLMAGSRFPPVMHTVGMLFMAINSIANPIIYALRMKSFRQPMKEILCCLKKNRVQPDVVIP